MSRLRRAKTVTFYVRVREHLVPVRIKTNSYDKQWLLRLQHEAHRRVWGHVPEFIARLARDGLDFKIFQGDLNDE